MTRAIGIAPELSEAPQLREAHNQLREKLQPEPDIRSHGSGMHLSNNLLEIAHQTLSLIHI